MMTKTAATAARDTNGNPPETASDGDAAVPTPNPGLVSGLLRRGVSPHVAIASAQARAQGLAARKRRIRAAAAFYDRARDLPPLWPQHLDRDLLTVDNDIGRDWTRHILLRLARMLRYHRSNPQGRSTLALSIAIAMTGEAAILRRQSSRLCDCRTPP